MCFTWQGRYPAGEAHMKLADISDPAPLATFRFGAGHRDDYGLTISAWTAGGQRPAEVEVDVWRAGEVVGGEVSPSVARDMAAALLRAADEAEGRE